MQKNKDDEFLLISKILDGDSSGFRIFVERYKDLSFSLACSILKNEHDAEDALQEAFIKAFKGLKNFNFKSSFSTWFYKIVVNTCFTKYKNQKRNNNFTNFEDEDSFENDFTSDNNTPLNIFDLNEKKEIINLILDKLKNDESLLLRLYYLAELKINEIKKITGFSDSKIKVSLHRARKNFKLILENNFGTEINISR